MRHVIFTRPHQLHRLADCFRDLRCLNDEVNVNPPTKTAAQEGCTHADIFGLHVQRFCNRGLRRVLPLRRADQLNLAVLVIGGEVHRLQRRMRKVLADVLGANHFLRSAHDCIGITHRLQRQHGSGFERAARALQHGGCAERRACTLVPGHRQGLARLVGTPPRVGDDSNAIWDLHHRHDARHRLGAGRVDRLDFAADDRALLQRGVHHARQLDINAELCRAVGFGGRVQALRALADNGEVFRVFERHFFRHGQFGRFCSQGTIGRLFAVGAQHHAIDGFERTAIHIPFIGGGRNQHLAHLRATDPQLLPTVTHRRGTTRKLGTANQRVAIQLRVGRGNRDLDASEVDVELFSNQHRHRGVNALPHLRACRDQSDLVVVADVYPCIGRVHSAGRLGQRTGQREPHQKAAAANSGSFQEATARAWRSRLHSGFKNSIEFDSHGRTP